MKHQNERQYRKTHRRHVWMDLRERSSKPDVQRHQHGDPGDRGNPGQAPEVDHRIRCDDKDRCNEWEQLGRKSIDTRQPEKQSERVDHQRTIHVRCMASLGVRIRVHRQSN